MRIDDDDDAAAAAYEFAEAVKAAALAGLLALMVDARTREHAVDSLLALLGSSADLPAPSDIQYVTVDHPATAGEPETS